MGSRVTESELTGSEVRVVGWPGLAVPQSRRDGLEGVGWSNDLCVMLDGWWEAVVFVASQCTEAARCTTVGKQGL